MSEFDLSLFEKQCEEIGITLTKRQQCQFCDYFEFLVSENEKINLTAITEFNEVFTKHFIDSISLVRLFQSFDNMREALSGKTLCDVGTGAGFPGVPLKILIPELNVTLFDSLDKRVKFLNALIDKLELSDISAYHGRVEDLSHDKRFREQFDFATARAVASLPVLSEYCIPFVKPGGKFIPYKSEKASEEIKSSDNALKILGGRITETKEFLLPQSDLKRTLIVIEKEKNTPSRYPRKAGTPGKSPL